MVPPEKTPAKSTAQIRKDQLEKKKAQLAAKDGGAGNKSVPRSLSKMLKRRAEEPSQAPTKARRVPSAPASTGRPPVVDRPTSTGKSLKSLGLNTETVDLETREPETPSSRQQAAATGSNAAGGRVTPQPENEDASQRWLDLQQYAKRMLRSLTRSEKEAVPAVHQVNLDRLIALLAETMIRIDSLKVPLKKKQEEVRDANRRTVVCLVVAPP